MKSLMSILALTVVFAVVVSCSGSDKESFTSRGGKPTKDTGGTSGKGQAAVWYQDADGDSYGNARVSQAVKRQPEGFVADSTDCDDSDPTVNPGAEEACDGADNNCDGAVDNGVVMDSGYMCCDGRATDIMTDANNCGACGKPCPEGWVCQAGTCVDPNPNN